MENSMELPENFFQKNEEAKEDIFKSQFEEPAVFGKEFDEEAVNADGSPASKDDTAPEVVDFKFDDALAQEEKAELDQLNAKFNTDFKTLNDFHASLKRVDNNEKIVEMQQHQEYINYFEELLNPEIYSDHKLVLEDKLIMAKREGKNISDPDVLELITEEVDNMQSSGSLTYAARTIRATVQNNLDKRLAIVTDYNNSQALNEKQKQDNYKQQIQDSIAEVFKEGKFMGVIVPTKEDMIGIYKDVSKNKHIEHLKDNPKDAVEYALFKRYKDVLLKSLVKPGFNAGVKSALDQIGMSNSQQTSKDGTDNSKDSNAGELTFLQQFAK